MENAGNLKEEILTRSLKEVKAVNNNSEPCVICLESLSEGATTNPCHHHNFDYLCLLSWLEQQDTCPLCKSKVKSISYKDSAGKTVVYIVPDRTAASATTDHRNRPFARGNARGLRYGRLRSPPRPRRETAPRNLVLSRRRDVYRNQIYSSHVGSNRSSAYQDLTPQRISESPALVSRARAWIRRELEVFTFLDAVSEGSDPVVAEPTLRNISNAFFLLEYMIAILKTVDIKGSSGQAQDMLADFLGQQNAKLFLHELSSFLRSPYETPETWDKHVQYPEVERRPQDHLNTDNFNKRRHETSFESEASTERSSQQRPAKRRPLDRYIPI